MGISKAPAAGAAARARVAGHTRVGPRTNPTIVFSWMSRRVKHDDDKTAVVVVPWRRQFVSEAQRALMIELPGEMAGTPTGPETAPSSGPSAGT